MSAVPDIRDHIIRQTVAPGVLAPGQPPEDALRIPDVLANGAVSNDEQKQYWSRALLKDLGFDQTGLVDVNDGFHTRRGPVPDAVNKLESPYIPLESRIQGNSGMYQLQNALYNYGVGGWNWFRNKANHPEIWNAANNRLRSGLITTFSTPENQYVKPPEGTPQGGYYDLKRFKSFVNAMNKATELANQAEEQEKRIYRKARY